MKILLVVALFLAQNSYSKLYSSFEDCKKLYGEPAQISKVKNQSAANFKYEKGQIICFFINGICECVIFNLNENLTKDIIFKLKELAAPGAGWAEIDSTTFIQQIDQKTNYLKIYNSNTVSFATQKGLDWSAENN